MSRRLRVMRGSFHRAGRGVALLAGLLALTPPSPASADPRASSGAMTPAAQGVFPPGPAGVPVVTFRRGPDLSFRARSGQPHETLLGKGHPRPWFAPDGHTMVLSGPSDGVLVTGSGSVTIPMADPFDISFSPDSRYFAVVQPRAPLSIRSVPSGALVWQQPQGREWIARWLSPTLLVTHDGDSAPGHLLHVDVGSSPPRVQAVGAARYNNQSWASADGRRWIIRDDYDQKGGVLWLVDGMTGAASVLSQGYSTVVGSSERVCFDHNDGTLQCMRVYPRELENVAQGVSMGLTYASMDDTGSRLVFEIGSSSGGFAAMADFATQTVRATPQAALNQPGSMILLSGGRYLARGLAYDTTIFDFDAGTMLVLRAPPNAGVSQAVSRRPGSWIAGRGLDVFVEDMPP
jgi:hypothetical protein